MQRGEQYSRQSSTAKRKSESVLVVSAHVAARTPMLIETRKRHKSEPKPKQFFALRSSSVRLGRVRWRTL
jgi:hypothetical protein